MHELLALHAQLTQNVVFLPRVMSTAKLRQHNAKAAN